MMYSPENKNKKKKKIIKTRKYYRYMTCKLYEYFCNNFIKGDSIFNFLQTFCKIVSCMKDVLYFDFHVNSYTASILYVYLTVLDSSK